MASLLLSCGSNLNDLIDNGEDGMTTPWAAWLHVMSRAALDNPDQLEVADIAEMFLNAGADLLEDLQEWVRREFIKRRHPYVRAKGDLLLQLIWKLGRGCSISSPDVSQSAIDEEDHDIHRSPTEPIAGTDLGMALRMTSKRAIDVVEEQRAKRVCYGEALKDCPSQVVSQPASFSDYLWLACTGRPLQYSQQDLHRQI